jgi:curved DNA-binding protein CbpA
MDNPYEILGVKRDADKATIEKAYRAKARKSHPDAKGDREVFKKVNAARQLLIDDQRRQRFDETGETSERPQRGATAAEQMVGAMVQEAFLQPEPLRWICNRIDADRFELNKRVQQARSQRERIKTKVAKFERVNKATKNQHGYDFIKAVLDSGLAGLEQTICEAEDRIKTCDEALTLLNDLRYPADFEQHRDMRTHPFTTAFWQST